MPGKPPSLVCSWTSLCNVSASVPAPVSSCCAAVARDCGDCSVAAVIGGGGPVDDSEFALQVPNAHVPDR